MSALAPFAGDRRMLGGYLDFYMRAKQSPDGIVVTGISGLESRWSATEADVRAWLDTAMSAGLITRLDQTPEGSRYSVMGVPTKEKGGKYSQVFEEAWAAYPRQRGHSKSLAWKRWGSLLKNHRWTEEALLELVRAYATECSIHQREDRFIKHMSSFLNHELLTDIEFDTEVPEQEADPDVPDHKQVMANLKARPDV